MSVKLQWEGKPKRVERLTLPFQLVERVNESKATRQRDEGSLLPSAMRSQGKRNLLVWGDNKLVMGSLLKEHAGTIKLVYIDPPFDTGADFSHQVQLGDTAVTKLPSILEVHAYRDTWGQGKDSYLSMMYERLVLIHELLADDGSLVVHLDWHQGHYMKVILDEIFGEERFLNEIIWWYYNKFQGNINRFASNHDALLWYSKTSTYTFNRQHELRDKPERQIRRVWDKEKQAIVNAKDPLTDKVLYQESTHRTIDDVWRLSMLQPADKTENVRYDTQKPLTLARRVIEATTDPDDLVADFFCGSGTALVAAEQLGRQWIGGDLGRFAIHTTRKRLLSVPDCRPFDVKNLGAYERQRWQQVTGNGALRAYLNTILAFYQAEQVDGFRQLHGRKAGRMVHVGATDAPVTAEEAEEVMDELADSGVAACDLLGWDWEMGLHDTVVEDARRRGLDLRLRQIPREVMERRVAESGDVQFFELAYLAFDIRRQDREVKIALRDFIIPSEDLIPTKVRERITRWSDLIDYWSVDFDYSDEQAFHNQWQAYRTRSEPVLTTETSWHEYTAPGRHAIVVKVIDIFGNDTTKLAEARVR